MQVTLDAPLTLNPQTATRLVIRSANVDFDGRILTLNVDMVSAGGTVVERRVVTASGAAVQTYIANQESTFCTRLLAAMGVTGTVA